MTSLLMGNVWNHGVPQDLDVVRATSAPVDNTAPAAEMDNAPDINEFASDPNPNLGLASRGLASKWHDPVKSTPDWAGNVDDATEYNARINRQVGSSGVAAQKELTGEWGHGTMAYAEGIEPVQGLVDGTRMGNEYFAVDKRPANGVSSADRGVQPPSNEDQALTGMVAESSKIRAREAAQAALYAAWLDS